MNKINTISLGTAKKWAKKWRRVEGHYNKHHECKAFNIPKIDLLEVLAEDGVVKIRAYLGVDDNNVEKLMIVGVDAANKDMISAAYNGSILGDGDGDIFDLTSPCPDMCDLDSPLNG